MKPAVNTRFVFVVTADVLNVPVLVTNPVNVEAPLLLPSVMVPALVVVPVTVKAPVVLMVNCEPDAVVSAPLIV